MRLLFLLLLLAAAGCMDAPDAPGDRALENVGKTVAEILVVFKQ